jgi:HD-GYP domain-containing protein (c-di-GMP phosphodiesterase class II)
VLIRIQTERSTTLGPHTSDVGDLAAAVAERLGMPEHRIALVGQAAELHDIGKMAIPDAVIEKTGPLTDDEWVLIREHSIIGERMLSVSPALRDVGAIVRASHESYDGSGYPDNIGGQDIPLEARIIAATDAYCAMTSDRPYRSARTSDAAIDELQRCAGRQFDPSVVEALISVLRTPAPPASSGTPDRIRFVPAEPAT